VAEAYSFFPSIRGSSFRRYIPPEGKVSPEIISKNHAPNSSSGDTYDTGDTLHTLAISNIDKKSDRVSLGLGIRK
jgi:hypothetical protein